MAKSYAVDDFVSAGVADERISLEQRDHLLRLAESGANASTLLSYLRDLGYKGGLQTVINWKDSRFGIGDKARQLNELTRQARGLMPSDTLSEIAILMLSELHDMYAEIKKRDLSDVKTAQLLLMMATYSVRVQEAIAQSEKVRTLADAKDLIMASLEEVRLTGRQTYEGESPELIAVIDNVVNIAKAKMDV